MAPVTATRSEQVVRRRRSPGGILIPLMLVLAGICGILYPVLATSYNNQKQREFAEKYDQQVSEAPPQQRQQMIDAAKAYNSQINGIPILDPWLSQAGGTPGSKAYQRYSELLNLDGTMGRVRIPSIGVSLPIRHGTNEHALSNGVGHLYGTSLPVGGAGSHSVLTAHSALSTATLFDELPKLRAGEVFYIDVAGQTLAYRVDRLKTVLPNQIGDLKLTPGKDYVTLFTCTPYAVNTHRLLVRAERIDYEPAKDAPPSVLQASFRLQTWMWWSIGGAALGGVFLVAILLSSRRRNRRSLAE